MTHEPLEHDAALERALREVSADPARESVDWPGLRSRIARRAAPELARRRGARHRRMRIAIPAALAASIALLVFVSRAPDRTDGNARVDDVATLAGSVTVDELLDADVSDRQFRALLFGASEADDLLLIAAEEEEPPVR